MSIPVDRREFLKTAIVASLPLQLPWEQANFTLPLASVQSFILTPTGECLPVNDPVEWSLQNATQPILERATQGLLRLSSADDTRILRLVTRRCKLNLITVEQERIAIQYWGEQGLIDLRPFFKQHLLACPEKEVILLDRKRECSSTRTGEDFLYGDRGSVDWPLHLYWSKWQQRDQKEQGDWTAAPHTWSGYGWPGIEPNRIPWSALKSAWRRNVPLTCLNCDQPTILVNFGSVQSGMFNRAARFIYACRICKRFFSDNSIDRDDVGRWLKTNLDTELLPTDMIAWDRAVKLRWSSD